MKRSKSRINSSCDGKIFPSEQCMDIERCQEELKKARIKYNKLNQNYLELKVEYNKLEKDYKYNVRIIEAIINESNIAALSEFLEGPKNTVNENTNNNKEKINQTSLSKTTIKILKEKSIYERLKLEIMNLREELKSKENTIDDLKNNVKTSKFKELDNKFAQMYQEYNTVKARNEILETMQVDYINSKNQIMFLLKQIDLYKKENKKLKEFYEKLLFDYQNVVKEREQSENIRNINEERIKALITKNNSLKVKLEDLRNKNLAYYEEIEKYKNLNQNQIDKVIIRKEKEINQYRSQITQLKLEIGSLQKKAEEKNKNTINSATGYKKIKPIYSIKKEQHKELRKTDSDFFVTKPKIILSNDKNDKKINNEKILINSKIKGDNNDNNNQQKKLSVIKIKDNKELEKKNESSDLIDGNHYENKTPNNIVIKGEKNMNDKKTTAYEEEVNMDFQKDELLNKEEKISEKEKEISIKNNSNNDDISKYMNEDNKNINNNNINENLEINKENNNEINLEYNTNNNDNIDINNNINQENQNEEKEMNYEEEFEKSEENKNENISQEKKKKYKEEEIVVDMSNEKNEKEEKSNQEKKNESSDGYNDFDSNIDKKSSLKDNNNITNEKSTNNLKGINTINVEQKSDLNENSNKLKESNTIDFNIKNENNNLNEEDKKDEQNEQKEKEDNDDEEYKFSSRNEGLSEEN